MRDTGRRDASGVVMSPHASGRARADPLVAAARPTRFQHDSSTLRERSELLSPLPSRGVEFLPIDGNEQHELILARPLFPRLPRRPRLEVQKDPDFEAATGCCLGFEGEQPLGEEQPVPALGTGTTVALIFDVAQIPQS